MIYYDNAATTSVSASVLKEMINSCNEIYGNPSSNHRAGQKSKKLIETSKNRICNAINCKPREIIFTSGGTESNNMAILGLLRKSTKNHIITSSIEHSSVYNTCKFLEEQGYNITYLTPNKDGFINPKDVYDSITENTALVSIMFANNEIGTIQPIREIGTICKTKGVIFHTDAVQAFGNISINVDEYNIDLMSVSGHKFHAPKGIGFLYVRDGISLQPILYGGGQQNGLRSGTENLTGIVGIGKAVEESMLFMTDRIKQISDIRNYLLKRLLEIEGVSVNGDMKNRLCGNINISIKGCEAESLSLLLDNKGVCVSAGSACSSGSLLPSRVLTAIGLNEEDALSSIRITLSDDNVINGTNEVDKFIEVLINVIFTLRNLL